MRRRCAETNCDGNFNRARLVRQGGDWSISRPFVDGRVPPSVLLEIFTDKGIGTEVVL